jgi:cerevisin
MISGIRINHTEFEHRGIWGANVRNDSPSEDDQGHGTHVAGSVGLWIHGLGIVAGKYSGVAKNATVIAVKALNGQGGGSFSDVIEGMQFVSQEVERRGRRPSIIK